MNNTYERFPVSVYKSTDTDAPARAWSANNLITILKAALVTGYGQKQAVGWTIAYEDIAAGKIVLKPPAHPDTNWFVRISADNGRQATIQVYTNMTDIDTGELKLQSTHLFKYGIRTFNANYCVIATKVGFWFFSEYDSLRNHYLYCGLTSKNTKGFRAVYLKHIGGYYGINDTNHHYVYWGGNADSGDHTSGKLYKIDENNVHKINPYTLYHGDFNRSEHAMLSPVFVEMTEIYRLEAFGSSRTDLPNGHSVNVNGRSIMNQNTGIARRVNMLIPTDYWEL